MRRGRAKPYGRCCPRRLSSDRRQARHGRISHRDGWGPGPARRRNCPPAGWRIRVNKLVISCSVNGDPVQFLSEPGDSLLDALREELALTGTKEGCGSGDCGACTVVLDGEMVCSCLVFAAEAEGRHVATIEGVAEGSQLHPIQQKFLEHAALQCGFCTPGFIVATKNLLDRNPDPSESEVRYWLAGNLCRCTGYDKIVRAVLDAAAELRQEKGTVNEKAWV